MIANKQNVFKAAHLAVLLLCLFWVQQPTVAADSTNPEPPSAEILVEQLGARSFYTREKAMAALISAGSSVEPQVRAALDHEDPEVRYRTEVVLIEIERNHTARLHTAFLDGDIGKLPSNTKSWQRLAELIGNNRESRQLFLAMLDGGEELMSEGENSENDKGCSAMITRLYTAQSNARRVGEEAITPGGVMTMMFLASDKKNNLDSGSISRVTSLLSQYRSRLDGKFPGFKTLMGHMIQSSESSTSRQVQMLRLADQFQIKKEGLELARKMLASGHSSYRAQAMLLIGKLGEKSDAAVLAKYIEDTGLLGNHTISKGKKRETKLGDVALAMSIVLSGEKPRDFGFPDAVNGRPTSLSYYTYGFYDGKMRSDALKKWKTKLESSQKEQ